MERHGPTSRGLHCDEPPASTCRSRHHRRRKRSDQSMPGCYRRIYRQGIEAQISGNSAESPDVDGTTARLDAANPKTCMLRGGPHG